MHCRRCYLNGTIVVQVCTMGNLRALNTMVQTRSAELNVYKLQFAFSTCFS